jgi:uncharacterized membrane protein YjjP (DUF1212 family)
MENKKMKGQANIFGVFIGGSILLLIVGMVLAFTYIFLAQTDAVLGDMNSSTVDTDKARSALTDVTDAVDLFPQWLTLVVLGMIIVGLLGLVIGIIVYVRNAGLLGSGGMQ